MQMDLCIYFRNNFIVDPQQLFTVFWLSEIENSLSMQAIPCAVLALIIHPSTSHNIVNRIAWAFCVYLEAVSVLPQLRVMQNTKVEIHLRPFLHAYLYACHKLFSFTSN